MEDESPELIEQRMQETRQSLTDKVSALEEQVVGTIQSATTVVQDTVETVKSAMHDTVNTVKDTVTESVTSVTDSVKQTLDVTARVRENPLVAVGSALAVGFVAGLLFFRSRQAAAAPASAPFAPAYQPVRAAEPARSSGPSVWDAVLTRVGQELFKVGERAVESASASIQQTVNDQIPKLLDNFVQSHTAPAGNSADVPSDPTNPFNGRYPSRSGMTL